MPLVTLGTGYCDCHKGFLVHYPVTGDKGELGGPCGDTCSPAEPFFQKAVHLGYTSIDTAYIYDTEKTIGAAVSGSQDIFITTKTVSPAFRNMLGLQHGTDTIGEQLRALQRSSVDVLYNHHDGGNVAEWLLLESEVDQGNARLMGSSSLDDALDHERCVKSGACTYHASLVQHEYSPCNPYAGEVEEMYDDLALAGNASLVVHSVVWSCLGEPIVTSLAKRLGRTAPQVAIRTVLQQGLPVIVQTGDEKRLKSNLDVFDFDLSTADLKLIALIRTMYKSSRALFDS
jgi:diketogulonate reductase-like aldo/keto reductase